MGLFASYHVRRKGIPKTMGLWRRFCTLLPPWAKGCRAGARNIPARGMKGTFPSRWLEKTHVIRGLKVYIAGDNLYTFTKYSGYDPEIHTAQGAGSMTGVLTSGFDYGAFPLARTFSIGANFEF